MPYLKAACFAEACVRSLDYTANSSAIESSWLAGIFVGALAFGAQIPLFLFAVYGITTEYPLKQHKWAWLSYTSILFVLNGMGTAAQFKAADLAFIKNRSFPGGPAAYVVQSDDVFVGVLGNVLVIVSVWFQDGLLVFRSRSVPLLRGRIWAYTLCALFTAEVALGCVIIVVLVQPGVNIWAPLSARLLIAYFVLSITLNVSLTSAIVEMIIQHFWVPRLRYRLRYPSPIKSAIDDPGFYVPLLLSLLGPALFYSVTGCVFLAAHGSNTPVPNLLLPTLSLAQSIVPLLDVVRARSARKWAARNEYLESRRTSQEMDRTPNSVACTQPPSHTASPAQENPADPGTTSAVVCTPPLNRAASPVPVAPADPGISSIVVFRQPLGRTASPVQEAPSDPGTELSRPSTACSSTYELRQPQAACPVSFPVFRT